MEKIKIDDFTKFSFLSALKYSPDGKHAVFAVTRSDRENNKYKKNLWLLDCQTSKVRQLTSTGKAGNPIWWDENTVVFPETRDDDDKKKAESGEVFTVFQQISIDGGEATPFLRFEKGVGDMIQLDKNTIAVLYCLDPKVPVLEGLSDKEKAEKIKLAKEEKDYEVLDEVPFWFNGEGFTNGQRSVIGIYDVAAKTLRQITEPDENVFEMKQDGNGILFSSTRWSGLQPDHTALKRFDPATGKTETIIEQDLYQIYWFDRWDGQVVFLGLKLDELRYGLNQNCVFFRIENGAIVQLPSDDWTPSTNVIGDSTLGGGKAILVHDGILYFIILKGTRTTLRRMTPDLKFTELFQDSRSIEFFDVYGDNLLFCSMFSDQLEELYHMDLSTGKVTRVTSFNTGVTADLNIIKPEILNITSDEIMIEGFVIKPADFDPDKKYPCILDIHGGPKCAYGDVYFHEMQVWANAGYFVIFCNPRGGEGRNNEFAYLGGKYGTVDYDDIMRFTDAALIAYPQIDQDRMGVTGGSYGGFMTNWIIGHTNRFKAAASQRSIANWVSFEGISDIGFSFTKDQNNATTWTDVEKLWWHSPLKYADKVTTPTLFIHSDNDYRCPMSEGLQMFTALKIHNVPARLCLFHGETHELSRAGKPLHRIRRLTEITNWFDKYLK